MSEILQTHAQQIKNHPYLAIIFFIQLFNNINLFKLHKLLIISIKLIYNSSRARAAVAAVSSLSGPKITLA